MPRICSRPIPLLVAGILLAVRPAWAEPTSADRRLLDQVAGQLLDAVEDDDVPKELAWPPKFELRNDPQVDSVNAFATLQCDGDNKPVRRDGKYLPLVVVCPGMMERVVDGEADRLALILGHELGHLLKGHVGRQVTDTTWLVRYAYSRLQEDEADRAGAELMLQAGYSLQKGVEAWRIMDKLDDHNSSFRRLAATHPAALDRVASLDKERATLWRAMSAFRNGTDFLNMEQYAAAAACFTSVTREFPASYEAWANLGYAQLMQYCDALAPEDLQTLGIGQIACGGFYRRPESLEAQTRALPEDLWKSAVESFQKALELDPNGTLAQAHLGLSYLVSPSGVDAEKATSLLKSAVRLAGDDAALDAWAKAGVYVNGAVACLVSGERDRAADLLAKADGILDSEGSKQRAEMQPSVLPALLYNSSVVLGDSDDKTDRRKALADWEQYLQHASPASLWRQAAVEKYEKLSSGLGLTPKEPNALLPEESQRLRQTVALQLPDGKTVALAEPTEEVQQRLGTGEETPVARDARLVRIQYPQYGAELIATDQLLAVRLKSESSPKVVVRESGLASGAIEIQIGQTKEEIDRLLKGQDYDFRKVTDRKTDYRFYPDLGLAIQIQKGRVREIVIAQIPRNQTGL